VSVALAALTCILAASLALVRLHLTPTGLDPVRDAVSDYGTTPFHMLYRAQAVLVGVAAILVAARLGDRTDATGLGWLSAFGATRIAIAAFMTDRPRTPATTAGRLHAALAVAAFTTIAVAGTTVRWSAMPAILDGLGTAIAAAAVLTLVTAALPPLRRVFGAAERLLYLTFLAWLAIAAAGLL
jgi:hypothetical protein